MEQGTAQERAGCIQRRHPCHVEARGYTEKELVARADVSYKQYSKTINIEALTTIDMAGKDLIPAVIRFTTEVAQSVHAVESVGGNSDVQRELLAEVTALLKQAKTALPTCAKSRRASITRPCALPCRPCAAR